MRLRLAISLVVILALLGAAAWYVVAVRAPTSDDLYSRFRQAISAADSVTITCHDPTEEMPAFTIRLQGEMFKRELLPSAGRFQVQHRFPPGARPTIGFLMMPRWDLKVDGPFPMRGQATFDKKNYMVVLELDANTSVMVEMEPELAERLGISFEEFKTRMRMNTKVRLVLDSLGLVTVVHGVHR